MTHRGRVAIAALLLVTAAQAVALDARLVARVAGDGPFWVGQRIVAFGGRDEARLILLLMPVVAVLSAIMSSTGVVALFVPVVLTLAR